MAGRHAPWREIPWLTIAFLAGVVGFGAWYMAPSLFRTWYYSSDDYVVGCSFSAD
jgi:hypothetical protein